MKTKQPEPETGEGEQDFMDRCVAQLMDEENLSEDDAVGECELAWEDRGSLTSGIVHKSNAKIEGREFILSDETLDRMGDVILSEGWRLAAFKQNPIALFNHDASFIVGRWQNLRVEDKKLRGHLELAAEGTSARIDELRKLVDAGILRAVSVGFKPLKHEPLSPEQPHRGIRFLEQELVETSLVSVPANPNALAVAKSLDISDGTMRLVFAGQGKRNERQRVKGSSGGQADTSRNGKGRAMSLAQRIIDVEAKIVSYTDELESHLNKQDDNNVSDADLEKTNDLTGKLRQHEALRDSLVEAEKRLVRTAGNGGGNGQRHLPAIVTAAGGGNGNGVAAPHVIKQVKKELDGLEYLVRSATIAVRSKEWGRSFDETCNKIYGEDEPTRAFADIVLRAASAPAMTSVAGWAQELAQQTYAAMMPLLMPDSIFRPLAAKGLSLTFGRAGKIVIPTRSRTPSIAGSFVGEGNPIPVRQGAFTSQTLTPKKMAVISVFTREMDEHSTPAIEGIVREAIQQDTSVAIDSVLIDNVASSAIRPAGLLNGVSVTTATSGGGFTAIVGDIKGLVGALTTNLLGNVRNLVFLMNPTDVISASLIPAPNSGIFPFKADLDAGNLMGVPVIKSSTVPAKTVILLDAADFVSVGGDNVRFELSDQATLHMDDTTPLELVAGSPGTVASPQRSLFQTDSIALRMILPLNWLQRRTGTVAWTSSVTW